MSDQDSCLGIIEVESLSAAAEAADTMLKLGNVSLLKLMFIGSKQIAVVILGETGPVQAAIEMGAAASQRKGSMLAKNVIPRCNQALINCLSGIDGRAQLNEGAQQE